MTAAKKYVARVGIDYPTPEGDRRVEAGEEIPSAAVKAAPWLLKQGLVEEVKADGAPPR